MLCILRLSLTSKWFGFTFLWSPAGRCLRGALPIAGTQPPLLLYPSTSLPPILPPILPSCHSTPMCPIPASLLSLSHTHTHMLTNRERTGWQDFMAFQPRLPAHAWGSLPPAALPGTGASGPASSATRSRRKSGQGTWSPLVPTQAPSWAPAPPTDPRAIAGPLGRIFRRGCRAQRAGEMGKAAIHPLLEEGSPGAPIWKLTALLTAQGAWRRKGILTNKTPIQNKIRNKKKVCTRSWTQSF